MLELRAIDLDDGASIPHQAFGGGLHGTGLTGARGSQKQEVADGPARAVHSRQERLINANDLPDRLILADDLTSQAGLELLGFASASRRVQKLLIEPFHITTSPNPSTSWVQLAAAAKLGSCESG